MFDTTIILTAGAIFLVAGAVKGVIGLGLPTIGVALLAVTVGLPQAMALLLVPSFVTNIWQALAGGGTRAILRQFWPFFLMATTTVWLGTVLLTQIRLSLLSALLGALLIIYSLINLTGLRLSIPSRRHIWIGALAGSVNGLLAGMTGSAVVPGVLFLQAVGLSRDTFVQAMGMLFAASAVALAISLGVNNLLTAELGFYSIAAVLPSTIGMVLGQQIRRRLSEHVFRRVFFISLLILGAYIIAKSFEIFDV